MQGNRVYVNEHGKLPPMRPGDYGQTNDGDWWAVLPDDQYVRLTDHTVEEHDDGTITVHGAIYDIGGAFALVRGVWQEAA